MLQLDSGVLIKYHIFQIPQFFLVPSTSIKNFLYFTRICWKLDSWSYSIFQKNFSVPLVKYLQYFHLLRKNLWILLQFYAFFSQPQKFCIYLLCLKLISTDCVFFLKFLSFSHEMCCQDIPKFDSSSQTHCL